MHEAFNRIRQMTLAMWQKLHVYQIYMYMYYYEYKVYCCTTHSYEHCLISGIQYWRMNQYQYWHSKVLFLPFTISLIRLLCELELCDKKFLI